jgi:hypothetical protein
MYRDNQKQLKFEQFYLPFGGKLRSDNRWVKLYSGPQGQDSFFSK